MRGSAGKSKIAAAKAVHQAACERGSLTIVVSPSARQSHELVQKTRVCAEAPDPAKRDVGNNISLAFRMGRGLSGCEESRQQSAGYSAVSLLLVDEAARVRDELYKTIRPKAAYSTATWWSDVNFVMTQGRECFTGLDLGQRRDHTALAVVERVAVTRQVAASRPSELLVDATGVGRSHRIIATCRSGI